MTSRNTWKNFSRPAVYLSGGITRNPQGLYNRSCPSISETMFLDLEFTRKPRVSDKTHVSTSQRWQWLTGKCIQQNRCFKLQGLMKPVVFKKSEDFISGPANQNREWLCNCCLKRDRVTRFLPPFFAIFAIITHLAPYCCFLICKFEINRLQPTYSLRLCHDM